MVIILNPGKSHEFLFKRTTVIGITNSEDKDGEVSVQHPPSQVIVGIKIPGNHTVSYDAPPGMTIIRNIGSGPIALVFGFSPA